MSDDLLKLAERCEAATGPDRELDALIWAAHDPIAHEGMCSFKGMKYAGHVRTKAEKREHIARMGRGFAPLYTASIDAAMTLVPEGSRVAQLEENWRSGLWDCRVSRRPSAALIRAFDEGRVIGYDSDEAQGEAAALALTAASLKARARSAA